MIRDVPRLFNSPATHQRRRVWGQTRHSTTITRIRGLVDRLTIERNGGITVQGNLAAMLALAHGKKAPSDDLTSVIKMVAGARNRRYLQLWSVGA